MRESLCGLVKPFDGVMERGKERDWIKMSDWAVLQTHLPLERLLEFLWKQDKTFFIVVLENWNFLQDKIMMVWKLEGDEIKVKIEPTNHSMCRQDTQKVGWGSGCGKWGGSLVSLVHIDDITARGCVTILCWTTANREILGGNNNQNYLGKR